MLGPQEERLRNQTEYNITYTPEELHGYINHHPDVNTHALIYGLLGLAMIVVGITKGGHGLQHLGDEMVLLMIDLFVSRRSVYG